MPTTSIIPATTSSVTSAITSANANASSSITGVNRNTIAGNFQTFLQLLTTQLRNQNPLDPLDTNQFTQQLVLFAQV
ncbi:MAG: flagellar biosynthesis protein FlgD, partial [Rhizobiales bacterium]|nr:flagellar biosynthesis protein FlgD [Hyphomicrobiales bacterium]